MKWSKGQIEYLKTMCFDGAKNSTIAEHFGVPVSEIYAKRSQLGITIPKVAAAKATPQEAPNGAAVMVNGIAESCFETFLNGGVTCIVLARSGNTALIARMLSNKTASFVVPLEYVPGELSWWQGHYFSDLSSAWEYYQKQITKG
jgi:hypothetical protein